MRLPPPLVEQIEQQGNARLAVAVPVGGGCISNTTRLDFVSGDRAFLKWGASGEHPAALFSEEARSLRAIAATRTVRVPAVIACNAAAGFDWLLLEWLEPGPRTARSQVLLGEQLAQLHRHGAEAYGWPADNFIGSLPQTNRPPRARWADFWRDHRLAPQLELAAGHFAPAARRRLDQLCAASEDVLANAAEDGPSLLHGDLWGGNLHTTADGSPAVIDPASYYGHREVDLAMARLFGGFAEDFYRSYEAAWPCAPGSEQRSLMYQLYYLLVHVNLFGGSYSAQAMSVVTRLGF